MLSLAFVDKPCRVLVYRHFMLSLLVLNLVIKRLLIIRHYLNLHQ